MDLVLLAAGFATRLEPLTLTQPKHLLELGNDKVFIDLLSSQLKQVENQFSKKVLITNDRYYESFRSWQKKAFFKVEIYNDLVKSKEERLGAIGDLLSVIKQADLNDDLLIIASDYILKEFDFEDFIDFSKQKKCSLTVAKKEEDELALMSGSCLLLDEEDKITKFEEKPKKPFSNFYGAPYYIVKKEDLKFLKEIPEDLWDNCGQIVAKLLEDSEIYGYRHDGEDLHMTTLKDYERIKSMQK